MKTLIVTTALVASILGTAITAQAESRRPAFDAKKFFEDIANRG